MLQLRTRGLEVVRGNRDAPRILRVSSDANRPLPLRRREGFISRDGMMPEGYAWYLILGTEHPDQSISVPEGSSAIFLPPAFGYIGDGDVVRIGQQRGDFAALYQRTARHHSFLLTERCNHYCLMCSQPPRDVEDGWIVDDLMKAIPLLDLDTPEIGFTGGEPTLLKGRLVTLIRQAESYLPRTALHILSNGRRFSDLEFAQTVASVGHHDLMFGIPIYSDLSDRHDYVVQSDGAFDETIRGILSLRRCRVPVEIRVVVHKQTYDRLPQLARFIARNLTFVGQVVFMGLEMMGFTKANLSTLWIDPVDYQRQLSEAVNLLDASRIKTSIYNHQLCVLDRSLWKYAKQSISDWKNEYMPECTPCAVRDTCGGFFSSAKLRYSDHIRAIAPADQNNHRA